MSVRFLLPILCLAAIHCGDDATETLNIPLVEPPVSEATPSGLKTATTALSQALETTEFKARFFSEGPTAIADILTDLDSRITSLKNRNNEDGGPRACLDNAPVAQNITVFGNTIEAWFQCYDVFSDNTGGLMFGQDADGIWYLYEDVGQHRKLAVIRSIGDASVEQYEVNAYISVGQANASSAACGSAFDGCSYGVIRVHANNADNTFEMATAGVPGGWGYCAAHIKSEGTNLFATGQAITPNGCEARSDLCALAGDLSATGACTSIDDDNFVLPTLGTSGATALDMTLVDTALVFDGATGTGGDAVHFGPNASDFADIAGISAF